MSSEKEVGDSSEKIPSEFKKIVKDFVKDILITFPEYVPKLNEHLKNIGLSDNCDNSINFVYDYCKQVFPERFFDILYQNSDIFTNQEINTDFLPDIDFKYLWSCDISDKTKETIWKYLQLILFTMVNSFETKESFGDTAKMFETVDESEFKNKLEETIGQMHNLFNESENKNSSQGINMDNIPNPEELHSHISGMLDGKLGQLAREIAEETAGDLNLDLNDDANMDDVFKKMMGDPTKLMGLVKNVGNKLDSRLKSGELKESELLQEAGDMMKKMKDMPGMENIQSMLSQMGMKMPNNLGGRKGKMNMGAFNSVMEKNMRQAKVRERAMKKAEEKRKADEEMKQNMALQKERTEEDVEKAVSELLAMDDSDKKNTQSVQPVKKKKKKKKN